MPYIPKYIQSSINKAKMMRKPSGEQGKYNSAWQKVSVNYRRANPLCEVCLVLGEMVDITPGDRKGCVDHMIPITRGGSMYNLGNLLALCKSCHDTKSILEKTSVAPVPIYMDADAKILPKDKADVVTWLAQQVQRKRSMEQQGGLKQ